MKRNESLRDLGEGAIASYSDNAFSSAAKVRCKTKKVVFFVLFVCLLVLSFSGNSWARIWYVKTDGSNTNSGTSWAQAYQTISQALLYATDGDEIWLKMGRYLVNEFYGFAVHDAIGIYGGFAGWETHRSQRDWESNVTIVDGQSAVPCFNIWADATIDGLTITNGHGLIDGPIATMDIRSCSPTISHCIFTNNRGMGGGAIYMRDSSPSIYECMFLDNNSLSGAIFLSESSSSINECIFLENRSSAIYSSLSEPIILDCEFTRNEASLMGGAIRNRLSNYTIARCKFSENRAYFIGGGIFNEEDSSGTITDCHFEGNEAGDYGGGIYNNRSMAGIRNCVFLENHSTKGGGIFTNSACINIANCTFSGNIADDSGGAIFATFCEPVIANCILWRDSAPQGPEIFSPDTSQSPMYCLIDQGEYVGQNGNIFANPRLYIDSIHLRSDSPCIDSGWNGALDFHLVPDTDYDGGPRLVDGDENGQETIDIGADEYNPPTTSIPPYRPVEPEVHPFDLFVDTPFITFFTPMLHKAIADDPASPVVREDIELIPLLGTSLGENGDFDQAIAFLLFEAGEIVDELDSNSFNNEESASVLAGTIDEVFTILDEGTYFEATVALKGDFLERIDGYAKIGEPDEDDWVTSIEGQALLYPLVTEIIELLESML